MSELMLKDLDKIVYNPTKDYWQYTGGDCDILVKSDSELSDKKYYTLAKTIISDIDKFENVAIEFLESFLKLNGKWFLFEADFGCCNNNGKYDFSLTFSYEDQEYIYTYFVVHFKSNIIEPRYVGTRPIGLEIGFY